jgi:hypothetical protein
MLDIGSKLPAPVIPDQVNKVTPAAPPVDSVIKSGAVVILSPDALKLSRELQAVKNDPDNDPAARFDASVELRQIADQILTAK